MVVLELMGKKREGREKEEGNVYGEQKGSCLFVDPFSYYLCSFLSLWFVCCKFLESIIAAF